MGAPAQPGLCGVIAAGLWQRIRWLGLALAVVLQLLSAPATAHLMPPQRGTLNFTNGGGWMVLSLPVSAFAYAREKGNVSANGNQLLSVAGYSAHHRQMVADVEAHVQLLDDQGPLKLEGTLLNFTPPDNEPNGSASQIVVLGRFNLRHPGDEYKVPLRWRITLFGTAADEQSITTTVTRVNPQTGEKERQLLVFDPGTPERVVFPSTWAVLGDYVRLGMEHILTGFDHLLFLLVVLAAASGWRQVMLALTCFTVGHAATLTLSLVWGVQVSAAVVEPAIAFTIVAVALYDLRARRRERRVPQSLRLAVVFGCALIHGLGLASSLRERGLDQDHLWQSLLGFNVGIELGQVLVSACIGAAVFALGRMAGPQTVAKARVLAGLVAIAIGSFWFVQRLVTM